MSRIYFHSLKHGTAELSGRERAWMDGLLQDVFLGLLGNIQYRVDEYRKLFPPDHYIHSISDDRHIADSIRAALRPTSGLKLQVGSKTTDIFSLALNTMWLVGNDPMRLMARLHAQCEVHCWVEGKTDREWVVSVIEDGMTRGIMREDEGWEEVIELLGADWTSPVVCSYSVCESFPNVSCLPKSHPLARRTDCERYDEFRALDVEEQWGLCMAGLKQKSRDLRIKRHGWDKLTWGEELSVFDILRP